MNFFSNLFGNVTATILRLVLIAGTLALVYFFAIRPVLDTTEEAFKITNDAFEQSGINDIGETINKQIEQANRQTEQALERSFKQTTKPGGANPQQLLRCVKQAKQDAQKLQACAKRFGPG